MAFITGLLLLDAPASALNNAGAIEGSRTDNGTAVKFLRTRRGAAYPYVSGQSFRYWLRTTLENTPDLDWSAAPVYREGKIAYTDANPLRYWDDDLFGYMRAQSKKTDAAKKRQEDATREGETPTATEITRVSPFRVSTLVSLAPVPIETDFGTMTRQDGPPVPHEHQFYRAVLKGLLSLNLAQAGTFSYVSRTGFLNLDQNRIDEAKADPSIDHLESAKCYRLAITARRQRIESLLRGLALLCGGAKGAIHYTDVTPAALLLMVTRGGNNPLHFVVNGDDSGLPSISGEAVQQMLDAWRDQILSPLYLGWVKGFHDSQAEALRSAVDNWNAAHSNKHVPVEFNHPRLAIQRLIGDMGKSENASWLG